jgi:hypothetical protein
LLPKGLAGSNRVISTRPIIEGDERVRHETARLGRWSFWTLVAALPLGCAAFLLARRRRRADDFEAWWRQREELRGNGHLPGHVRASGRRDDLFV